MANTFDPDDSSTWSSVLGNKDKLRKLDFELPNGMAFRDIRNSDDISNMVAIMEALNISSVEDMAKFIRAPILGVSLKPQYLHKLLLKAA